MTVKNQTGEKQKKILLKKWNSISKRFWF
jgi:hypothetical protein